MRNGSSMSTSMLERISQGETYLVFDYIDAGHSVNSQDHEGVSLIKCCAYDGDVSAIKFLVRNGESLQSLGDNFDLIGAVFHGCTRLCQFLIEQGADVSQPLAGTGETPLHSAQCEADRKDLDRVLGILLANGANPNCVTKPAVETDAFMRDTRTRAETPLHRAAALGNEACRRSATLHYRPFRTWGSAETRQGSSRCTPGFSLPSLRD